MTPSDDRSVVLAPPRDEQWTLHHALLDRLQREADEGVANGSPADDPSIGRLRGAFATLDGGGRRFTVAQLEAIRRLLASYHHRTSWWEVERPRIERLLDRVTDALAADRPSTR